MSSSISETSIERVRGVTSFSATDLLAVEEPLEIQLEYGPLGDRRGKSIAVTMRTPGHDLELAVGFLVTEGVIRDPSDVVSCDYLEASGRDTPGPKEPLHIHEHRPSGNTVRVQLAYDVTVSLAHLSRNFYTTSSCGICGKASLLALQSVCPARTQNRLTINAETLYSLPLQLRKAQAVFDRTGGLHGAALFDAGGGLISMREDVGRHNALDKLIGSQFLQDRIPLRDTLLMLSGRASFELLQKALMGGISMVAAVGAPSSLAVQVARQFDIVLIGFLRADRFNVYHGAEHLSGLRETRRGNRCEMAHHGESNAPECNALRIG
jgi:FdhD protein